MSHIAGIACSLGEANTPQFKKYAKQVIKNSKSFAQEIMKLGWRVVSGGTDSHLILIDTWMNGKVKTADRKNAKEGKTAGKGNKVETVMVGAVPGKVAEAALEKAGIICNIIQFRVRLAARLIRQESELVLRRKQLVGKQKKILLKSRGGLMRFCEMLDKY